MQKKKVIFGSIKRVYESKGNTLAIDIGELTNLKVDNKKVTIQETTSAVIDVRHSGIIGYLSDKISTAKRNLWYLPIEAIRLRRTKDGNWKAGQEAVVVLTEDKELWTKPVKPTWEDMDYIEVGKHLDNAKKNNLPNKEVKIRELKKKGKSSS